MASITAVVRAPLSPVLGHGTGSVQLIHDCLDERLLDVRGVLGLDHSGSPLTDQLDWRGVETREAHLPAVAH